jgi:hypothetical protein
MSVWMKSSSAAPDLVRMSRSEAAMEAAPRPISSVTMAGSVSIGAVAPPGSGAGGPSSGSGRMKPSRSRMVRTASAVSGSDLPMSSRRAARLDGEASRWVTSTNSRPPASAMGAGVVICQKESPRGFMASVIIC